MENITHQEMVRTLCKAGGTIKDELTPGGAHILHMTMGIAGEAGEIVDAVKKHIIYNKDLDIENLVEELGDMEFYLEGLRQAVGITREETLAQNMGKLATRYGGKYSYSDAAAIARRDKE